MTSLNISLPDSMRAWIDEQVAKGAYSTASEFVRGLIRDAQKRQAQEELEAVLLEGLNSGESTPMTKRDWEDIRREGLQRLGARKPK